MLIWKLLRGEQLFLDILFLSEFLILHRYFDKLEYLPVFAVG
jgi:hypothetical protein